MSLQFTLKEYIAQIRMSERKHLLVEGKGDKRLFKLLLLGFHYDKNAIDIDSAEELIGFENGFGNRDRVEEACRSIHKTNVLNKLVGFVDREFREFDFESKFVDKLACHNIIDELVWSRGHSIENYYFDFELLSNTLANFSKTINFDEALELFKIQFESVIQYACAASLAGRDAGTLKVIRGSIKWKMFTFDKTSLLFDEKLWRKSLINVSRLEAQKANEIVDRYSFWLEKVQKADFEVARWMCHGHIGLSFICAAFGACIFEACRNSQNENPENQVQKYLSADEDYKFNSFASTWVQKSIGNQTTYPIEVLKLLQVA